MEDETPIRSWHDMPKCNALVTDKKTGELRRCRCAAQPNRLYCHTHAVGKKSIVADLPVKPMHEEGDVCPNRGPDCPYGSLVIKQDPCYCAATRMPPCSHCEHSWLECNSCGERS